MNEDKGGYKKDYFSPIMNCVFILIIIKNNNIIEEKI
jgi:hypothetical protein